MRHFYDVSLRMENGTAYDWYGKADDWGHAEGLAIAEATAATGQQVAVMEEIERCPSAPYESVSLGFVRDDGDFELMATLNNTGGHLSHSEFDALTETVRYALAVRSANADIVALERTDAPDVVTLGGE